jgi:hypothetical protein
MTTNEISISWLWWWNLNLEVDGPGCIYFLSKRILDNFDMTGDIDQPPLAQPTLESTQTGTEKALSRPPQTLEELLRPPQTLEALPRPPQTLSVKATQIYQVKRALSRPPQTLEASRPLINIPCCDIS